MELSDQPVMRFKPRGDVLHPLELKSEVVFILLRFPVPRPVQLHEEGKETADPGDLVGYALDARIERAFELPSNRGGRESVPKGRPCPGFGSFSIGPIARRFSSASGPAWPGPGACDWLGLSGDESAIMFEPFVVSKRRKHLAVASFADFDDCALVAVLITHRVPDSEKPHTSRVPFRSLRLRARGHRPRSLVRAGCLSLWRSHPPGRSTAGGKGLPRGSYTSFPSTFPAMPRPRGRRRRHWLVLGFSLVPANDGGVRVCPTRAIAGGEVEAVLIQDPVHVLFPRPVDPHACNCLLLPVLQLFPGGVIDHEDEGVFA